MLSVDVELRQVPGVRGMFSSRARVTPNMDGVFQITMINVTESDITLSSHKIIGLTQAMDQSIARVDGSTISDNDPNNLQPHLSNIQFGENLTTEQKETAQNLINQYADVFAVNPKKPQKTNLMEHLIITSDALPVLTT